MIFFDNNRNSVRIEILEKISHIYNSHYVYKTVDGKCLKVFRIYDIGPSLTLDEKIQSYDFENFYKILQYLFDKNNIYSSMLMPFYSSCSDDILLKSSDYLSDNFSAIFCSFDKLGCEGIETRDANYENMIFTEDKIIIVDTERYYQGSKDERDEIRRSNYSSVCWLLYSSLLNAASKHLEFRDVNFYNWFRSTMPNGMEMCCELSNFKYPIDYMRRVKKKI